MILLYISTLLALTIFSYGFVDTNFPLVFSRELFLFVHTKGELAASLYSISIVSLFICYLRFLWLVKRKKIAEKTVWFLIGGTIGILLFSFPGFSYDIFNYIATAKVIFLYKENPYIIMPIDIPNEPMLAFTHAANKIALYGPVWILLTFIPHIAGFGNIMFTIFAFKVFIAFFYVGTVWLLWQLSKRSLWAVVFFALNPLVIFETLVSSHNDITMMFFALLSSYLLIKGKTIPSLASLFISILIKYATIFLLPIYILALLRKGRLHLSTVWYISMLSMYFIFFLSPLREEIYSWYFIWILPFVALLNKPLTTIIALGFSFGLLFRIVPFLYTQSWAGVTPIIKSIVTFASPLLATIVYVLKKKI